MLRYLELTGDSALLDEPVPFLEAPPLQPEEAEVYGRPTVSSERATLFEHCLRAIDRGLTVGPHGLPLIGNGDWNDGMSAVGREGRGESVFVGWFLLALLREFAPLCEKRGEPARAARYRAESARLADMDIPEVHFGIGMNSGEVVAAHVGGGRRRQYDIVGDTVNIGSRMCGQAGKGDIVMPIDCYRLLDDPPPAESMGFVALKNVERPMELMRIRVDEPVEPAERDEQDEPSAQETARDEVPVAAPADDATMRA